MPFESDPIALDAAERAELEQMTQSRTLQAGDVFRARLILLLADGVPYRSIEERLDTTAPTISRWKDHFLRDRVAGLIETQHPGQKPFVITPALQPSVMDLSTTGTAPCHCMRHSTSEQVKYTARRQRATPVMRS